MITERIRKPGLEPEDLRFSIDADGATVDQAHQAHGRELAPVIYYAGERIYFRPVEVEDEPLLRRWVNDPRVWRYLQHRGPVNALREREWIDAVAKSKTDYTFGVVARDGDRLIGATGLRNVDPITRSALFGIMIGEVDYHGLGYGTEATRLALKFGFHELNLNRIELSVYGSNWRAIRVYQKCGFVPEGCLRQAQYRNGQYEDEYRFAILREDWNRRREVEVPRTGFVESLNG